MQRIAHIFYTVLLTLLIISCSNTKKEQEVTSDLIDNPNTASGNKDDKPMPVVEFEKESHDFGKITQGEKVSYSFKFKNTGKANLLIASAQGSCGCTVPHYPTTPIAPGNEGTIDVVFDSEGKEGVVKKTVTVVTNALPNTKTLTISTEIIVPENSKTKENN